MSDRRIVIDGFYADPYRIRQRALNSEFLCTGNYPGRRTLPVVEAWVPQALEKILDRPIVHWPIERDNGAFQLTYTGDRTGVHADPGWVGLVYLTPDPPLRSGTIFYRHLATNLLDAPVDTALRIACEQEGGDPCKWEMVAATENVFNRLVLFEGTQWHSAGEFFGDAPETGRLFQTFFFWLSDSIDW